MKRVTYQTSTRKIENILHSDTSKSTFLANGVKREISTRSGDEFSGQKLLLRFRKSSHCNLQIFREGVGNRASSNFIRDERESAKFGKRRWQKFPDGNFFLPRVRLTPLSKKAGTTRGKFPASAGTNSRKFTNEFKGTSSGEFQPIMIESMKTHRRFQSQTFRGTCLPNFIFSDFAGSADKKSHTCPKFSERM